MLLSRNKSNILYLTILTVITSALWYQTISLPYWWDSAGFIIRQAHQLLHTNFWPLSGDFSAYSHPPLFALILALSWKFFGESILVSHIAYFPFILLCIYSVYFLGQEIVDDRDLGKFFGFLTALLLLFTPVFVAQMGIVYLEIPVTALTVLSYIFYLKQRYVLYALAASLMVLMREFTILIVLLFLMLDIVSVLKKRKKVKFVALFPKSRLWQIAPLAVLFMWFVYHKISTGWWIIRPGTRLPNLESSANLSVQSVYVFTSIFISQWRVLFTITLVILLVGGYFYFEKAWKDQFRKWTVEKLPLLLIPLVYTALFIKTEFLMRYAIIIFPFLYLVTLYTVSNIAGKISKAKKMTLTGIITLICCFLFYTQWDLHRQITKFHFAPLEDNLEYINVINVGKKVSAYVEKNYPDATVYTSFPFNYMLLYPYEGYVGNPIEVKSCSDYRKGDKVDVIIYHLFSPGSVKCYNMLRVVSPKHLKQFSENGKYVLVAATKKGR